jgi:hypothetical protein
MPSTWTHPELGTFEFDHGWNKELSVPAFNLFRYASWNRRPDAFPQLSFVVPHEHVLPSAEAIGLATAVLTNQTSLARAVSASMWDELNGRGPETGMWWHGIVKGRWGDWQRVPIPEKEEELWEIMRLDNIIIGEGLFPMRRGKGEDAIAKLGHGPRRGLACADWRRMCGVKRRACCDGLPSCVATRRGTGELGENCGRADGRSW